MKELSASSSEATIRLTSEDLDILLGAINEVLESVEDWEFSTRTGFEKESFRVLQAGLNTLRIKMEKDI